MDWVNETPTLEWLNENAKCIESVIEAWTGNNSIRTECWVRGNTNTDYSDKIWITRRYLINQLDPPDIETMVYTVLNGDYSFDVEKFGKMLMKDLSRVPSI